MRSLVTPSIEQLVPYEAGKPIEELTRELGITDAVKLASNENPLGPSPRAIEAMRAALAEVYFYPDSSAYRLRDRLAAEHGVPMDQVIHGNGSNELIDLLVRTFSTPADHLVFAQNSFVAYKLSALAHGVAFTEVPLRDWRHDLEAMAAAVTPRTRLVFVANPNNPTSTHVGRAAVQRFLAEVPPEVIVVMDEAYIHYADAGDYPDSLELRGERERLVVLRTFSKVYGLAGLRVGYGIAPAGLIDYLSRVRMPFNVSSLGQAAALAALDDREHVQRSVRMNQKERGRVAHALAELGFTPPPSQANFLFLDLGRPGRPVYEELLALGVIVRPIGDTNYLRVTLGKPEENDRFLRAFKEVKK
jgi:histidinol-phosphate aminotransferase